MPRLSPQGASVKPHPSGYVLLFNNEGSGWAFSAVSAVEGVNKIATGNIISLSEQEIIDCASLYNNGSDGGLMDYAYDFILHNDGIVTEEDYPYTGKSDRCDTPNKKAHLVSIDRYEDVPPLNENALQRAVVNQPVSAAIEGGGRFFQFYSSGVFSGRCGTFLDHAVTVVGYGSDSDNGLDYWIIRNSWGTVWGESGYMRMITNVPESTGKFGIALEPSYPVKTPNPPPSPTMCDSHYSCPATTTCCCTFQFGNYCFGWECCPFEAATCCHNPMGMLLQQSKDTPMRIKALKRTPAKPNRARGISGIFSSA